MNNKTIDSITLGIISILLCLQFSFLPEQLFSEYNTFKFSLVAGGVALLACSLLLNKDVHYKFNTVLIGLFTYALFHLISFTWAIHPSLVWTNVFGWTSIAVIFWIVSSLPKTIFKSNILVYLIVGIIITNFLHLNFTIFTELYKNNFVFQVVKINDIPLKYGMNSPNYMSSLLLLYIPVLAEVRKHNARLNMLCIITIISLVILIPFFSSRATTLVLFFTLIFYCIVGKINILNVLRSYYIIIIIAGIAFAVFFSTVEYKAHFIKSNNPFISITNNAKEERLVIWKSTLSLIKQKPIFGHGSGNWATEVYKFGYDDYIDRKIYAQAHNFVLQVIAEIGLIGALIFLFISCAHLYNCFIMKEWNVIASFLIWLSCSQFYALYLPRNGFFLQHI